MERLNQAHQQGLVIGLKDVDGPNPVTRLDIDILLHDHPDTFNLLLIAFKEIRGDEGLGSENSPWYVGPDFRPGATDKMNWSKIAGIHGLPKGDWDNENVKFEPKKDGEYGEGYCVHQHPTFGPWHRPYLAMLEQSLYRQAVHVVERFENSTQLSAVEKKAYSDALKMFRLPYWDYFRPRDRRSTRMPGVLEDGETIAPFDFHVPRIFTVPHVMIKTLPDNVPRLMENPFFNYKFKEGDMNEESWKLSTFSPEYINKSETIRWGGNNDENIDNLNLNINKIREDNVRTILHMFDDRDPRGYPDFKVFSTTGLVPEGRTDPEHAPNWFRYSSLESVHGSYHVFTGGYLGTIWDKEDKLNHKNWKRISHLICVPVSSWDPIFWFHHCQVDRLFAIWQAINPDSWFHQVEPDPEVDKSGPLEHVPLYPFRKAPLVEDKTNPERYWSSEQARHTETFGYNYPDTAKGKSSEDVRQWFKEKYDWSRRLGALDTFRLPPKDMEPLDLRQAQVYQYAAGNPLINKITYTPDWDLGVMSKTTLPATETVSKEYFIDVIVELMAVKNAFTIFFGLEDLSGETGTDWGSKPGFIGVAHIFTAPPSICGNCARNEERGTLVTHTVAMASLLYDYVKVGKLASLNEEDVRPFLVKNLKWRVQSVDGKVWDPRDISENHTFKIGISVKTAARSDTINAQSAPETRPITGVMSEIIVNASPKADGH